MTWLWKISGLTHDDEGSPRIVFRDEEGKFVYWQKHGWCGIGSREWEKHSDEEVERRIKLVGDKKLQRKSDESQLR